ncbi:MAG: DEAD/DEAH box helicase [Clostridia bacterium]|nr:DEAD/DEAH box helicase [Clostridia bacterium]
MGFQELTIKKEYRSLLDNIVKDFYIPLLSQAVEYKRAVGFFSSSVLAEISKGISGLVKNGGKIKLVASPFLSEDDIKAIRAGYTKRNEIIKNAVIRELREPQDEFESARLNLLANLIADDILDIKIAFTESNSEFGMYHEKMGIIEDPEGNEVVFSGSMNESATALKLNYETIDVFCSWIDDPDRISVKENAFSAIWNNTEPNVTIIDFPELSDEIVRKYKRSKPNFDIDEEDTGTNSMPLKQNASINGTHLPAFPNGFSLHQYQKEAIDNWEANGYRGIFDMATGTGKTYTGLGAIVRIASFLNNRFATIIVCPYQHLVEQWVEDIEKFNICPIIGYSASSQKDWKKRLETAVRDQKLSVRGKEFFCFICTNATFGSAFVQEQIAKIRGNKVLVVDEAHNFGAPYLSKLLYDFYDYRLALSATLDRHNDEEGTEVLYRFFGEKCIEYSLERAIKEKKLTPYKYYPIVITLSEEELAAYDQLSYEIGKCVIKGKNGRIKLSEKGKKLALKRARIVAGARAKLDALKEQIYPYVDQKHILVYCGATKGLEENQDYTTTDEVDLRQIDEVTSLLGNELNMQVSQFTSKEDIEERATLKAEFAKGETLQALIAIKCLDEGVNIPQIKTAFILASTTNPKEYIQRRGRVLRLAEGKEYAEIFDFITVPYPLSSVSALTEQQLKRNIGLVRNELSRAEEFARIALNMAESEQTLDELREAYNINDTLISFEEDIPNE